MAFPFECSASFTISFSALINAEITLNAVSVDQIGDTNVYEWQVAFTYVSGKPPATAFRLNSADGLAGTFTPSAPQRGTTLSTVQSGTVRGTARQAPRVEDVVYSGTVTIIQA